jgi:hypothetical protein
MEDEEDDIRAGINIDPHSESNLPDPRSPGDEGLDEGGTIENGIHIDPRGGS